MRMRGFAALIAIMMGLLLVGLAGCDEDADETEQEAQQTALEEPDPETEAEGPVFRTAPPPEEGDRSVAQRIEDATVAARVRQALAGERSLRTFDFEPEAVEGHVTLYGDVRSESQYHRAEEVAEEVEGVRGVSNEITIEGESFQIAEAREAEEEGETADAEDESADEEEEENDAVYHTVQSGESLWTIARQHDTSVSRLQQLNDLAGNRLQPGDRLRVR